MKKSVRGIAALTSIALMSACSSTSPSDRDVASLGGRDVYAGTCSPDEKYCAYFSPSDMPIHAVADAIRAAKKRIRILAYNLNVDDYVGLLAERLNQGVEVDFVVDYVLSSRPDRAYAALKPKAGWKLKKYRIPNLRGRMPQMHNKILLVDDRTVYFGSANFTYNGLVANYENVIRVDGDEPTIARFDAEVDEMIANAKDACEQWVTPASLCGTGEDIGKWDKVFDAYAMKGSDAWQIVKWNAAEDMPAANASDTDGDGTSTPIKPGIQIKDTAECANLKFGLLDVGNQPAVADIASCFVDAKLGAKFAKTAAAYAANESYVADDAQASGPAVSENPPTTKPFHRHNSKQTGAIRTYFSPEDNVDFQILRELEETIRTPADAKESFAFLSTNFVTNRRFAETLVKMNAAGVRVRMFFDRGRYNDPTFQQVIPMLKPFLTVFDNQNAGVQGCVHNKFAVIYTPKLGLRLLNGSANWSAGAMQRNDENFAVFTDEAPALIYLREFFSQLYVYKYGQNVKDAGFQEDLKFALSRPKINAGCLRALLAIDGAKECKMKDGTSWEPRQIAANVLAVNGVPFAPGTRRLWAWVPQLRDNKGAFIELFSYANFDGQWVTTVPLPPNWDFQYKFFSSDMKHVPKNGDFNGLTPEWAGTDDRWQKTAPLAVHSVRDNRLVWGKR
jgi:phosphatidylserine/phosphatidylglycerophosphate/cardiolipin synthase-like enzyme